MTTIAHQGVGVPMSQSQSSSPDEGREQGVEEPLGPPQNRTDDLSDLAQSAAEASAGDTGTDTVGAEPLTESDRPVRSAVRSDPSDPPDRSDVDAGPGADLEADFGVDLEPDLDASGLDRPDLDSPSATPDTDDDRLGDHSGPLGRVLAFRRTRPEPDRGQLIELYQSQRLRLTRMAILLVDDLTSAEDVVQDAFVELHRRWDSLVDKDSAVGYLRISVINKARSALRRRRTARSYSPPVERAHDQAAEAVVLAEEHREVLAAIKRLPPRQREILVLRYWSDMTEAEIADTLGISRGAVKSTASRALDAMERMLEGRK